MKLANNGNDLGGILLGKVARCFGEKLAVRLNKGIKGHYVTSDQASFRGVPSRREK